MTEPSHSFSGILQRYRVHVFLFLGIYLLCGFMRIATSYDSRWSVPLVLHFARHGDLRLDEYETSIREMQGYGVVCVGDSGVIREGSLRVCPGHWYSSYPVGGPLLAAPLILPLVGAFQLLGLDVQRYHPLIEMEAAAVFVALTAVLLFDIARRTLSVKRACWLALLFALTTSAFSSASRALWSHTPSILLLTLTIHLLLRAEAAPRLAAWAGLPVALAYTVRPSNALFVVLFTAYVAVRHRKQLLGYLLCAAPVAALFVAANFSMYGGIVPPYYVAHAGMDASGYWSGVMASAAGLLLSPSRGLFIFTPLFLFAIAAMGQGSWRPPLAGWLRAGVLLYITAMVLFLGPKSFPGGWTGGHTYGPRLLKDLTPIFILFLIPYLERWDSLGRVTRHAFVALALVGFAIHYRAGWSEAVWRWNVTPNNIDQNPGRAWDWRDAQFLRWRVD